MSRISILLASYEGAAYLPAQLESIAAQEHRDWALFVSDDGSEDGTPELVQDFARAQPEHDIHLLRGPGKGAAANFLSLLRHPEIPAGPVALADQDDVWMPHRLSRGLEALRGLSGPALHCGTSIKTDAALSPLHDGPPRPLPAPDFHHALVQNTVAGNTITMNAQALAILRADPVLPDVPFHDWWLYLRLMGAGAQISCDQAPCLYYRQHGENVLGDHWSLWDRLHRARLMANGTYRRWLRQNLQALLALPDHLTPQARAAAQSLLTTQPRHRALRESGAYRTDAVGRRLLPLLARLGRI